MAGICGSVEGEITGSVMKLEMTCSCGAVEGEGVACGAERADGVVEEVKVETTV